MLRISKISITVFSVIAASILFSKNVHASTLDLLGVGWNKSEVTVFIKSAQAVTSQAVSDVKTAIDYWNTALDNLNAALQSGEKVPTLVLTNDKRADIIIQMKVGGGMVLGSALPKTASPFSCSLESVSIQLSGKAFGQKFSDAGARNVARRELGHALGLGHCNDPDDLMSAAAESSEVFGDVEVSISDCDIKGIDAIYPLPNLCAIPGSVTCP